MRTALKEYNFVHLEFLSHKDGTTQYGLTYQIIEGKFSTDIYETQSGEC